MMPNSFEMPTVEVPEDAQLDELNGALENSKDEPSDEKETEGLEEEIVDDEDVDDETGMAEPSEYEDGLAELEKMETELREEENPMLDFAMAEEE